MSALPILEIAMLDVKAGREAEFEAAFERAQAIIASMPGYLGHELSRCVERGSRYALLVRWTTLEAHTQGFRGSPQYQEWKTLLHGFYDPFPAVEHFERIAAFREHVSFALDCDRFVTDQPKDEDLR